MVFSEGDTQKLAAKYLYNNSGEVIGFQWVSGSDAQPSYYYLKNLQGDITGIVNSSGKMQISYSYDVFGKRTTKHHADSSTMAGIAEMMNQMFIMIINPFGYRGYCYDEYTDLYYLQSRYYDPNTGRFINADDTNYLNVTGTVLGCNLFAYCENDAVNNVDPSGYTSTNYIGKAFKTIFSQIHKNIVKFVKRNIGYINGAYLYISNSLISNIIDTIIYASSDAITATVKTASIKYICKNIKNYARNNSEKVARFLRETFFGKVINRIFPDTFDFTKKALAKIWGKKVAKFFAKNVIIERLTKNFTVYTLISYFTSFGPIVALLFDFADGVPDGYLRIKVR